MTASDRFDEWAAGDEPFMDFKVCVPGERLATALKVAAAMEEWREMRKRMPKTADGATIAPDTTLYALSLDFPIIHPCRTYNIVDWDGETKVVSVMFRNEWESFDRSTSFKETELYSTRELAEAALAARKEARPPREA